MGNVLTIKDLSVEIMSVRGLVKAVRGVNFSVGESEILGIVGESGCGKSMTIKSIMRLSDEKKIEYGGSIKYKYRDKDVLQMSEKELQILRGGEISMIFQDPMVSFDPLLRVGDQIVELILQKQKVTKEEARKKVIELFRDVEIMPAEKRFSQYPFQMSGGMLQRAVIAMAFASNPRLLLADEPTTALDVTTQAQILALIKKFQKKDGMSVIVVTHNLGVVAEICDRVSVMYAGQIVENANVTELFDNPRHPYTYALMESNPTSGERGTRMKTIEGTPPLLYKDIVGCPFAPRCEKATEKCFKQTPSLTEVEPGHTVACYNALNERSGDNGSYYS